MSQQQQREPDPNSQVTFRQAKQIFEKVKGLHPLLSLLEEPEAKEGGPIEAIQSLLETILTSQHQLHLSLEDLHAKVDAWSGRKRSSN